ncbi:GMC oxidoreductase [Amylibacter sp.]|nr:GMC oxidoreductase [Amylibacter sp.]
MLTDLNDSGARTDNYSGYDVTIIGAGAAGITLALKLSSEGKKVALIEAGGLEYSEESQQVYSARTVGDPYFELDVARLRYFGGTTNHWGGMCRTFEREDFNRGHFGKEYLWPIGYEELDRYRAEACEILEIPSEFNDVTSVGLDIDIIDFNFSPPVRFGTKYFDTLVANPLVDIFLNSNLIDVTSSGDQLTSIKVASYNGNVSSISSQNFVFAMGGIENSRYLLWLQTKYGNNFISDECPIGKYWMEHPSFRLGEAIVDKRKISDSFYSISPQAQIDDGIMNCHFRVQYIDYEGTKALLRDALCQAPSLGQPLVSLFDRKLICGAQLYSSWEQSPAIHNRITLDDKKDKFGIPKPVLNWTKSELDRKTLISSITRFNDWVLRIDGGRFKLNSWILNDADYPLNDEPAAYHHMGGTRMHSSKEYGVVDENCKVYGSSNLYIAGSSIFTTGGHHNPTLSIVQFSLRLAAHLAN